MKELQPLNQNVLLDINPSKEEQKTKSGLIIPDTAKEKPQMARVIALGTIENPAIAPGDMVLFKLLKQKGRRNIRFFDPFPN